MASSSTLGSLLSAVLALILIHAPLSAGSSSAGCDFESAACTADADCLDCMTGVDVEGVTTAVCSGRYPSVFSTAEGRRPGFCETTGATNCCAFEDDATAETCLNNAAMVAYWQCQLIDEGCEVNDMPCYSGTVANNPTPAPTSTQSTASTTQPSSYSYSFSSTSSETPPPSVSTACEALSVECLEDSVCLACATSADSTTTCRVRYPDVFYHSGGESGGPSFCESTGAEACCEFSDNDAASECMTDAITAAFWLCKVEQDGCSAEDMPCYNSAVVTDSVSSSTTGTDSPSAAGTRDEGTPAPTAANEGTSAPTAANEGDAVDTETNANGAVGMPVSPNVAFASGLLVAAAGMFLA